jgi:hypothetical protein
MAIQCNIFSSFFGSRRGTWTLIILFLLTIRMVLYHLVLTWNPERSRNYTSWNNKTIKKPGILSEVEGSQLQKHPDIICGIGED